jgi:hypothetical protein
MFKGLFNRKSLEVYYYEALFILEQDYGDLKKTLMMNEIVLLALTLLEEEMFPSDMFMPNVFSILLKGILDVLLGKIKVVYLEKLILRFTKVVTNVLEIQKINSMESFEMFHEFNKEIMDNFELIPKNIVNQFICNIIDFAWYSCSDFN